MGHKRRVRQLDKQGMLKKTVLVALLLGLLLLFTGCSTQLAQETGLAGIEDTQESRSLIEQLAGLLGSRSESLQIVGLLTILSLAPSILIMLTGFTRIVIVLSFTRNAMGTQQMPPNQVIVGLALFLTLFIMSPILDQVKTQAYDPYVDGQIELTEAVSRAELPIKEFMLRQMDEDDLTLFMDMSGEPPVATVSELSMKVVVPAFITSEIKRGFLMGFFIYIPFIVIDMIVASTLMSMGMMMLPPIVISLPFKVLLFVMVDGWMLTIGSIVASFG